MSGEYNRSDTNGDGFASSATAALNGTGSAPGSPAINRSSAEGRPSTSGAAPGVVPKPVEDVMYSDIGINTLLNRLKQSIASARDFAAFLKKRSSLEEEQATGLKRLAKSQLDTMRRAEVKTGSYASQLAEVMKVHERMADNGMQFALSLHQMHEDLNELSANMERGRKQWKHEGLDAEKRASDAEATMQKAKTRYDSLAEDYDRARTGDTKGSKRLGLKGPKSAEQYEQDLQRKTQAADQEYEEKVKAARSQREKLVRSERPRAVKSLLELIRECDSALTLQLQKFATFNEKLLLGNGLAVTPLADKGSAGSQRSLRDVIFEIDNDTDFNSYIRSHVSKIPSRPSEIKYEQHPTLAPKTQKPSDQQRNVSSGFSHTPGQQSSSQTPLSLSTGAAGAAGGAGAAGAAAAGSMGDRYASGSSAQPSSSFSQPPSSSYQQQPPSLSSPSYGSQQPAYNPSAGGMRDAFSPDSYNTSTPPYPSQPSAREASGSPRLGYPPHQQTTGSVPAGAGRQFSNQPPPSSGGLSSPMSPVGGSSSAEKLPALRPVFGVSLDDLFARDQSAVPMLVIQCILAVDTFGLDVEGIYRLSGTSSHIQRLKSQFDHDASNVDFRNPANFFHDVNSVATLMKQFFRDLPDPLFTRLGYQQFIDAARIEDPDQRRDALHQGINDLPDPNYATLRALVLHLHRVMQNESRNRMGSSNLALCFAPSLMGQHTGGQIADASLQARVLDTILVNATAIFDED